MSEREYLLESLIARFIRAQDIDINEVPRLVLCGCESCLLLVAMLAEVEEAIGNLPPPDVRMN